MGPRNASKQNQLDTRSATTLPCLHMAFLNIETLYIRHPRKLRSITSVPAAQRSWPINSAPSPARSSAVPAQTYRPTLEPTTWCHTSRHRFHRSSCSPQPSTSFSETPVSSMQWTAPGRSSCPLPARGTP